MLAARYNRPGHEIVDHRTYVVCSDGDLMEGVSAEASSIAGHLGARPADRDLRRQPHHDRGRHRPGVHRGRRRALRGLRLARAALRRRLDARRPAHRPRRRARRPAAQLIILRTHIAPRRAERSRTRAKAHGAPLGEEEIRAHEAGLRLARGRALPGPGRGGASTCDRRAAGARRCRAPGRTRFAAYRDAHPDLAAEFERVLAGTAPGGLGAQPADVRPGRRAWPPARRAPRCCNALARRRARAGRRLGRPRGVEPAPLIEGGGDVRPGDYSGRNLHFGIREHGMGSILNGLIAARRAARASAHVPDLLRLHAAGRPPRRAHGRAGDLRLDARLGLARRGRPDAPAGRAPHGAAGRYRSSYLLRPCDANEDGAGLARGDRAHRRPVRLRALAPGAADARPLRARACRGPAARRLRAGRRGRHAGRHRHGERLRGARRARGARRRCRPRASACASSRCRAGSCSTSRTGLPRRRCCRPAVTARVSIEAGVTFGWEKLDRASAARASASTASAPRRRARWSARELGISPEAVVAAVREVTAVPDPLARLGARCRTPRPRWRSSRARTPPAACSRATAASGRDDAERAAEIAPLDRLAAGGGARWPGGPAS